MNRWRNYGLYISLASVIYLLLKDKMPWSESEYQTIITKIMFVLASLGVISNPKEGKYYIDDKQE